MHRSLPKRNIGVTGFMSVEELQTAQEMFIRLFEQYGAAKKESSEPRLMAGILVSSKTIKGISNKYPGRFPKPESLRELFLEATAYNTLNLAHYSTDTPENLVDECERVMEVAGPALHGFQLNICWPDPLLINELRRRYPNLHILLQIGARALGDGSYKDDISGVIAKVKSYNGELNGVLLDPSGGKGIPLSADQLSPLVGELMEIDGLGIGVAGGLSALTINLVSGLVPVCPHLGIDAEGRLCNADDDSLDLASVESYLRAAFCMFYPKEVL